MTEPAQIERRRENTRRSVTRDNPFPIDRGGGYFQILVPSVQPQTGLLPAYLPLDFRQRDRILDSTVRADAMWSAAIGIAITKAAALAWEAKSDGETRSKRAQELLLTADATSISGIGGWVSYMGKQVRNFTCTNAGCFTEIIRATGAYGSRIVGLGHLSALRMRRTGDPEYPFIYIDRWGRQHVMRWWQVFNLVDMPDPDEAALGVGLCAAERAYQQIRKLAALEQYLYEKISGSRPLALHIVNGLTKDQLTDMMASASENQASKGLSLYMGAIVATTLKPDSAPSLVTIPLAELPDGFEATAERDRADLIYANALGLDPQDLKPMSNQQMGAGAQSEVLNQKAEGRGQAAYRQQLTHMLNQLVFDNKTQFLFTEHDYRDQQAAANVSAARGTFITGLVSGGVISPQQGQQVLVEQGELPKAFIEQQAQAGSDLSDTDKPDVNDPLNDLSGPPQPQNQPAMQTQQPAAPPVPVAAPDVSQPQSEAAVPPLVPKAPSTIAQPKAVLQQKAASLHQTTNRTIHAGARRILRQLNRKGSISAKDDSGGVWRYIHGHPVLIKDGAGGGGSGEGGSGGTDSSGGKGKGKKAPKTSVATGSGTDTSAIPKPQKNNVPTHGAGGASKYPTLDAYKKGQISHENALQMLQADIKSAKLAGDTKAVNTLNTQYYGLKKAGPKPNVSATTTMSAHEAKLAAHNVTEAFANDQIKTTSEMDHQLAVIGAKSGHSVEQLKNLAKEHEADLHGQKKASATPSIVSGGVAPKTDQELIDSVAGSPMHMHAEGLKQQIDQGAASFSDVNSFHLKANSEISQLNSKIDGADAAIASAKAAGMTPLPAIVKMKEDAKAQQEAIYAIKKDVDTKWNTSTTKFTNPVVPATKTSLHETPEVLHAAQMYNQGNWGEYDKALEQIKDLHGVSGKDAQIAVAKAIKNPPKDPLSGFVPVKTVSSGIKAPTGPTITSVAKDYGLQEGHLSKAQSLIEKHKAGTIADATYNTQMYKITKEAGVSKAQLEKAAGELGSTPKGVVGKPSKYSNPAPTPVTGNYATPKHVIEGIAVMDDYAAGKITGSQKDTKLYDIAKANGLHSGVDVAQAIADHYDKKSSSGAPPLAKTPNPISGLNGAVAAKVAAMPSAKQDLIKLGAVYDTHGGTSAEYTQAIKAYNTKHGTTLDFQSAGPAVKSAKQEAGIPIVAQNKPSPSSYPAPTPSKPTVSLGHIPEIFHNDPLPGASMSSHELNEWGLQSSEQWSNSLTSVERSSIKAYTGSAYGSINGGLRGEGTLSPSVQNHVNHIDAAMAKASMPRPVTAMRGFSSNTLTQKMNAGLPLDGAIFHDNGFISSSLSHGASFGGSIKMKINIPKGSKAMYLGHISGFGTSESELLLARDANFKIKGYTKVGNHWQLEVDYIGSGPMPVGSFKSKED